MNYDEFDQGIFKLKGIFGEKAFSDERTEILWTLCSHVPVYIWDKMIIDIISNCRLAPIGKDFEVLLHKYNYRKEHIQKHKLKPNIKMIVGCGMQVTRDEYDQHMRECFKVKGGCFEPKKFFRPILGIMKQ